MTNPCTYCGEPSKKYHTFCSDKCIQDYAEDLVREDRKNKKDEV